MNTTGAPHSFAHEAMGTTFHIDVAAEQPDYARQAAGACFEELDAIDRDLSRFVESSDISRINRLSVRASTVVALHTFRCLQAAEDVHRVTDGAFDVAYASQNCAGGLSSNGRGFEVVVKDRSVRVLVEGLRLDLGGIGKGYSLDAMAKVLRDWDVSAALLRASKSTLLATEPPPGDAGWSLVFGPEQDPQRISLCGGAISGSGTRVKGDHIVDPRTGRPAAHVVRCWARAPKAAVADAVSTALMVMKPAEVRSLCRRKPSVAAFVLPNEESMLEVYAEPSRYSARSANEKRESK